MNGLYRWEFAVPKEAIDGNHHVNNVQFVQWMQDAGTAHALHTGGTAAARAEGGTWYARSHQIEYLAPAFENDRLLVLTWIVDLQRVRSRRRYRFLRAETGEMLARAESLWIFVDRGTGKPRSIPASVSDCFIPIGEEPEIPAC